MRELKFRVWWKDESEPSIYTEYELFDDTWTNSEYIAIEQYTGLKDKNGKEIYEGDIVDYNDDGDCIGYVVYNAPNFEIMERTGFTCWLKGGHHQRVIGNIHENPELLEQEDARGGKD